MPKIGVLSCKGCKIATGGIAAGLFFYMILLSPYKIFGNEFGIAWAAFVTATMTYLASSIVSKLAFSFKLKKYNITDSRLKPKVTYVKGLSMLGIALAFGAIAGTAEYLSPDIVGIKSNRTNP